MSPTAAAGDTIAGLMRLHPFTTVYIADLDAIDGRGDHDDLIDALTMAWPHVEFWIDNGIADLAQARDWLAARRCALVLGSESQTGTDMVAQLAGEPRAILSLDFRGDGFVGPPELLERADLKALFTQASQFAPAKN